MNGNLIREKIMLDEKIAKETSQILLEGDLIVPDVKPDMAVVLQTDAKVSIERVEALNDRVSFVGKLEVQVLYLARGSEKPVHSMSIVSNIDDFINAPGVTKEMWVSVKADIANIDYKMLNDRKLNYRAVIDIAFSAESTNEHNIVTNISDVPQNQLLKNNLSLNRRIDNKTERITIKDELVIPSGKPNIREVLQCMTSVCAKEVRVTNGKVVINGEVAIATLYRGDNEANLIEFVEHEVALNGAIEISGAKDDMMADVKLTVIDQNVLVRQDSDGEDRVMEIEVTVCATVKVHCTDTMEILEDAYCINQKIAITKTPIKYPKLICRNKNQATIKEVVSLDDNCPDILQIFKVKGQACVDETKIIEDKVVATGVIHADILYVAGDDKTPLYSFHTMIPYRQIIETKGAISGMDVEMDINIDHVGFNMLSNREMELRFLLTFNTQVVYEQEMNMITDMAFEEMTKAELDCMPSMTIYVVQKNDTLWKISKKFNTSIDELVMINEIENPNKIQVGQKLLILKKFVEFE